jgi:MFS family permease
VRKVALLVGAVVFVDTTFYAAITPLLPRYAEDFDLTKASAGVLTACYPLGTVLGSIPGGWLAVRFGVRRTVLVGLALMGASSIAFGFAPSVEALDAARFLQGVGGAFTWAGALSWLIAATPRDRRGEAIGRAMATAVAAGLTGPVLGVTAEQLGPEPVFSAVAVVAAGLAVLALRTPVPHIELTAGLRSLPAALRTGRVGGGMWIIVLVGLTFGVIDVLVPLRLDHLGASGVAIGVTFIVAALAEAVITPLIGRVSDRRGRFVPLRAGLIASGVFVICLSLPGSAWVLAPVLIATAPAVGFLWTPSMAMISDGAEASGLDQALAFGLVNLAWGFGQAAGAAGGGAAARATADLVPYAVVAGLCFLTLALLRRIVAADAGSRSVAAVTQRASRAQR